MVERLLKGTMLVHTVGISAESFQKSCQKYFLSFFEKEVDNSTGNMV